MSVPEMKIRTRSRLILAATLIVFLIVLGFITQSVILRSFGTIEKEETTSNVQRFIAQLNNEVEDVAATCRDSAYRDETTQIFTNLSGEGVSQIFPPVSMKNLGIDYIIVYDEGGHRVFSEAVQIGGNTSREAPPELDRLVYESILPEGMPGGVTGRRGISSFNNNPVILAGYPIQHGNLSHPAGGTLVMARFLDTGRIDDIGQMLQMDGTLVPFAPSSGQAQFSREELERAKDGSIVVRPSGDNELDGYAIITGIENKPSFLLLKIASPRPVNQQVKTSILIVGSAIILLSIIFLLTVELLLQRFILAPMSGLDRGMGSIGNSGDLALRIPEQGDEEILSLTRSFNRMLSKVQGQQDELHELLAEIEQQRDDLHEARQALADRNLNLEELNRKANFYLDIYLDVLTYEIRNAIMGLRGYAGLLKDTSGEKEREIADKITALAKKIDDVIRNIETISKIYKGPPELYPVNLCDVLGRGRSSWPGVKIQVRDCERTVLANDMLSAVLDNIFANSLKYGGREVEIVVDVHENREGMIEIVVTDNGPGIPDPMKPRIFDRFDRNSTVRSSYGLGLHIVKMLVSSYGGEVWAGDRVEHDSTKGAAIHFTLSPGGQLE